MLAEIKGKLDKRGSDIHERSEDKLTGDFFGSLRYLSFPKAMKQILTEMQILKKEANDIGRILESIDIEYWDDCIKFWYYHDEVGELDVLLSFEHLQIGIEVKYLSGLSSDDDISNDNEDHEEISINQLARQSRILNSIKDSEQSALLLFIAPEPYHYSTVEEVIQRNILREGVSIASLSWENINQTIKALLISDELNEFERLILTDINLLLEGRGLNRFRNFEFEANTVEESMYYYFKGASTREGITINFNVQTPIKRGEFYEFE
ncbi:hypothetical protein [Natranaerobius thermophilus]|uniref:NERD domain-containing protein n=1 Tax=Natranaerobius thermophilus (strain ATCC BAA-1301 / DSM 18059 / JW/NM-WN-LF) TaxID=457570 RepID=B2A1E3_NATTJ|nr:hypothetical protein [Natranaerobius thermophilus]ACB86081.1 hypothetical protein Nther_2520 [Natranaerobius thermophilus JW/NM-WN-LF]